LESQEDLLVRQHEKFVKLEKALAHEVEKNKILTNELKVCNDSISLLKTENIDLNGKIEKLNVAHASTSLLEHVYICTRCKDVDVLIEKCCSYQEPKSAYC
jgi:septal ring factor EnvC (AmiA/AmiB activator)